MTQTNQPPGKPGRFNVIRQGLNKPNIYELNLKARVLKKSTKK